LKGLRKAKVRVATKRSSARFLPAVVRRSVCALWFPLPKIGLAVAVLLPCEEKAPHHKEELFPFREARVKITLLTKGFCCMVGLGSSQGMDTDLCNWELMMCGV